MKTAASSIAPLVSVLIPLYNHERYILQCLESIGREEWPLIEVLIYDDCSTDNSAAVTAEWIAQSGSTFSKIELIRGVENQGIVHALNTLIEQAHGEYIAVVASDDQLANNGLSHRVNALKKRPEWLAVFGDAAAIDDHSELTYDSYMFDYFHSNKAHLLDDKLRRMEMIIRWSVPGPSAMYRAAAFSAEHGVGLFRDGLAVEDRDMYLRLLQQNNLGYVDQIVANYRLHANNTMNRPELKVRGMIERATPLLLASESPGLNRWEKHTAGHIAKALIAHAKARTTSNPLARIGFSVLRQYHAIPARVLAALYFRLYK